MLIVADENMPFVREWFAPFGEVRTLPGRALTAEQLREADALLVRSVTRVNRELLHGSRVRFVGSATSGIEHIDTDYLQAQGVAYASAPGCNATAVVEYVLSCLCALDGVLEKLLAGGVVGVIGLGNVGARLVKRLQALGIRCVGYDPFLTHSGRDELPLSDLDTALQADVICCHTPLTKTGAYPSWHLIDEQRLRHLRHGAVLINASRGAVVDNAALFNVLRERDDLRVALDVWEREPVIDRALLNAVALATPHIAGYSWDGKVMGTRMVLEAFCDFFDLPLPARANSEARPVLNIPLHAIKAALLHSAINAVYDVRRDDLAMREALRACEDTEIANVFDRLRKNYPQRREIAACAMNNWDDFDSAQRVLLQQLGFTSV
ncbi:MAG: 4-phosphoerythronate dehydrogenase [Spongiibacteraceae bacterium]